MRKTQITILFLAVSFISIPFVSAQEKTFDSGSLIIPMDLTYQDQGMFQAYGLLFQILKAGIPVYWVIDPQKIWHSAPCDEAGDECSWDCEEEGSGIKCPYPTSEPDFFVSSKVLWDGEDIRPPGTLITLHGYRAGPFVIDSMDATAAKEIIDVWNDQALWNTNTWAERTVFEVVSVHEATDSFTGFVKKKMTAAPTIAVFSDGNEDIATGYLRAAGIPQSTGIEFPAAKCGNDNCGPGTVNPDMLTVESIMGDMGTCDAPNYDHRNGALFNSDGVPAYCQIMSMHWNVNDRDSVECDGGNCGATQADCQGKTITYHGHEVVAEVRQFLQHRTHFFGECQAVNAYENTIPHSEWPFLDDADRNGHFLTTTGTPPNCPCTDNNFECVPLGCDQGTRDCCLPTNNKEKGAGFMIAGQPNSDTLQILHPEVAYMQMDGYFQTVGGSEPAYNLSSYLGSEYKNDMDVTFITGPTGPGESDLWMTGYIDGECAVVTDDVNIPENCTKGKVSYLGGHRYSTSVPISTNADSQGTRLFLNALFEADCVSSEGQPSISLAWLGTNPLPASSNQLPITSRYTVHFSNSGGGVALNSLLTISLPQGVIVSDSDTGANHDSTQISWTIGSIGEAGSSDPASSGNRWMDLTIDATGDYFFEATLEYKVGVSTLNVTTELNLSVKTDSDEDGVIDELDPFPYDPLLCGDSDMDGCDDCADAQTCNPDAGDPDGGTDNYNSAKGGCDCRFSPSKTNSVNFLSILLILGLFLTRKFIPGL